MVVAAACAPAPTAPAGATPSASSRAGAQAEPPPDTNTQPAVAAPPITWALSPAHIESSCQEAYARAQARIAAALARTSPSDAAAASGASGSEYFDALVEVETAVADLEDAVIAQTLLASVTDDDDVRQASLSCRQRGDELRIQLGADPALYQLAEAAAGQAKDPADRRLAEMYVEAGRRAGAGLDANTRKAVNALRAELGTLERAYMQAMGRPPTTITISAAEAASLPASFRRTLTPQPDPAADAGEDRGRAQGDGAARGYIVPVHYGTREPFMTKQASSAARRRYLLAFLNRGGQPNVERLEQALALRHQIAKLLGYKSWAAYKLSDRMAANPPRARALLEEVVERLLPRAREEIAALAARKAAAGDKTPFAAWDYHYYLEQAIEAEFGIDSERVRDYFPVDRFIPAVLGFYERLLGVRYRALADAPTWHPDASAYAIFDRASDELIGFFYLDLTPRSGKSLHFSHFRLRPGRRLPSGGYQRPIAAVIGNGPPAEPGKPARLSHNDAIIFFHEFGHLMHETLSTAPYARVFGTNVRRDFAEAPSQMFENFLWQPSVLAEVSSHVDTGEPLPAALLAKMAARKRFDTGAFWTRQGFFSLYDLDIHESGPEVDTTAAWFAHAERLTALPQPPGAIPQASFAGFMGGYDAGYYSYIWSKVFAQDMFSVFVAEGLDNPAVGLRYRREVLQPGGLREPDALLEAFLGRPVSRAAFYDSLGIEPAP
ncbi:MAG: oligopeptidase A [Haliangiales bacterium]